MNMPRRAVTDLIAAHTLYRLWIAGLNETHKDKHRRKLSRPLLIESAMKAMRERALNACRNAGMKDADLNEAVQAALDKHYRRIPSPKGKKLAAMMAEMDRAVNVMPLG